VLFNSYIFIAAFLPVVWCGYLFLVRRGETRSAQIWLVAASLFFYGWWNIAHVPVLLASIIFNFILGRATVAAYRRGRGVRFLLAIGVAANIALLAYFKYAAFVVVNVAALTGIDFAVRAVVLPLAISFFTFQQIAYLADAASGDSGDYDFSDYCLFVIFFPQLIAGPIVHHREMMDQFAKPAWLRLNAAAFATGCTFFTIGLFKKVVIADNLAPLADEAFALSAQGAALSALSAWHGVTAYTLQLYFDFSGYSDMAIGLALMFGVRLPYNFNSPYQATNIVDFWRRWHMTLSRFLRDYLYVPLGGNRQGPARRYMNLMITMVLGGLWHGAGWTFLIWGALHGTYLMVNHGWLRLRAWLGLTRSFGVMGAWVGRLVTLLAVMVGWVFFRAPDVDAALAMLGAMGGAHGWIASTDPIAKAISSTESTDAARMAMHWLGYLDVYIHVALFLGVAWFLPNSQEIIDGVAGKAKRPRIQWRPSVAWAACMAGCFLFAVSQMSNVSAFLYFQF
jgi:D-alanyl-lipoteichoic acid acyltransferase DltB (MBOAT superfamily)